MQPEALRGAAELRQVDAAAVQALRAREDALGYVTPDGRYSNDPAAWDMDALAQIDAEWRRLAQ